MAPTATLALLEPANGGYNVATTATVDGAEIDLEIPADTPLGDYTLVISHQAAAPAQCVGVASCSMPVWAQLEASARVVD